MALDLGTLGDLVIDVGADISGLDKDLDAAKDRAEAAGKSIAEGIEHAAAPTSALSESVEKLAQAEGGAAGHGSELKDALEGIKEGSIHALEILGVATGLEEVARQSIEAYVEMQRVEIALTAMTGSASIAAEMIEQLKDLAIEDALSFPSLLQAAQRMTAFGVSAEMIPTVLRAVAEASAATGFGFDQVASSMERMTLSGVVNQRQLVQMGLNLDDLAKAMNVTKDQAKDLFQAMDEDGRAATLSMAELEKGAGLAQKEAQSLGGQIQNLKNEMHFLAEEIGQNLAPALSGIIKGFREVVPIVEAFVTVAATLKLHAGSIKDLLTVYDDLIDKYKKLNQQLPEAKDKLDLQSKVTDSVADAQRKLAEQADANAKAMSDLFPIADSLTMAIANLVGETAHANNEFAQSVEVYRAILSGPYSLSELQRAYKDLEKDGKAAGLTQEEINGAIGNLPLVTAGAIQSLLDFAGDMREAGNASKEFMALGNNIADPYIAAMQKLQEEIAEHNIKLDAAIELYVILADSGTASAQEIQAALKQVESAGRAAGMTADDLTIALFRAQAAAAGLPPLTDDEIRKLLQMDTVIQGVQRHGIDMAQVIGHTIERDLSRALGDVIFQTGNIGDAFKRLGRDVVDIILNQIIKMAIDPLIAKLAQLIGLGGGGGGVLGTSVGAAGGAAGTIGSSAGAVGGAISGAVGGLTGIVGAVGAVGTMISSIIGNFQMARQENTLNAIELNTRQVSMFVGDQTGGLLTLARLIVDNTHDLAAAFNGWFHDAFASLMDTVHTLVVTPAGGTLHPAAVFGGGGTVNVTVMAKGGDARAIAREVVREIPNYLKGVSPKFSQ